jgi:PAS domain S-box-containing protein
VRLLQQQGKVVNYEVTARTKNGSEIKALTSAEKIEINGQEHIIWTTIDISEREQAEYLLRETSNYLNNLLDYANAPIIVWDPHFRISRFNPAFERLTGYKSNDVIGLGLDILFPENKKTESLQQIARTLSGERWEVVEISIRCIDGEERTVLWNSANVYDTNGKIIIATIAQGQDITERKQAEDALKISETQYRRLFEAAKDGILLLDADTGLILDVNPFLVEMLGLPYKEFIGKNLWELGYFRDIVASKANFSELQQNSYIRYENLPLRTVDGREMKVEFVSNLYKVDHRKIIQCNVRDITKRKQAEEEVKKLNEITKRHAAELEVANKELEAFAYSVSHDLRAPLRSMEGFSQALLEDCNDLLNDECKDYLKRIQNSAELMAQLIDDMLRLSRITRTDMILDYVDLTEMAQVIAAKLKNNEPKRKVNFVINPGLTAYGDEKLLSIVLENLFENAIKFTGKMREANIDFGVTEREGQKVYFVHDNGVGFDMAYANKLFKPFQRLHSLGEFPGTGIGLASVQRIIQRHGGQVWAEGKVGEGAIFYFTLG